MKKRIERLLAVGALVALTLVVAPVAPAAAQVGQPGYGEGQGAAGVQAGERAAEPVTVTQLPRTGQAGLPGATWLLLGLGGAASAGLGLALRRRSDK